MKFEDFVKKNDKDKIKFLKTNHYTKEKSMSEIARDLGTYPNNLIRLAKKLNFKTRSRSDIQSVVTKSVHPTRGKKRTDEERAKIGDGVHRTYVQLSDKEKQELSKRAQ